MTVHLENYTCENKQIICYQILKLIMYFIYMFVPCFRRDCKEKESEIDPTSHECFII